MTKTKKPKGVWLTEARCSIPGHKCEHSDWSIVPFKPGFTKREAEDNMTDDDGDLDYRIVRYIPAPQPKKRKAKKP